MAEMPTLDVVCVYANPLRWKNRLAVHQAFEQHMLASGVNLTVVECAYGNRPFELLPTPGINRVQVRTSSLVWNKENLLNLGIAKTTGGYICCIDADITFRSKTWAQDTVHALQRYHVVQPWSDCYDLGPNGEHLQAHRSFCRQFWNDQPVAKQGDKWWDWEGGYYKYAHSGYCWAYTRQALDWLGGLIETAALGAGDHHMALALAGKAVFSFPGKVTQGYKTPILQWQERATKHINRNVGFLWGTIEHSWHGKKEDRKYVDRWKIIVDNDFDPSTDLKKNSFGVIELAGNKPELTHDVDQYFTNRNEDSNTIS